MEFAYTNFLIKGKVAYQRIFMAEDYDTLLSHAGFCRAENESKPEKLNLPLEEILREIVSGASISKGSLNNLERYFSRGQKAGVIGIVNGEVFPYDKNKK